MVNCKFKITKEQYDRAITNNKQIVKEDMVDVFGEAILCGYGLYGNEVCEENGEYFVKFSRGDTCD